MNQFSVDDQQVVVSEGRRKEPSPVRRKQRYESPRRSASSRNRSTGERRNSPTLRKSPTRRATRKVAANEPRDFHSSNATTTNASTTATRSSSPSKRRQDKQKKESPPRGEARKRSDVKSKEIETSPRGNHSDSPRRKHYLRPTTTNEKHNESTTTFTSSKSTTISRSVSMPVVDGVNNNSLLKFDVDAPRDRPQLNHETATVTTNNSSHHTTTDDLTMSLEQKAWAGIASVLCDASVTSESVSEVLPQHVIRALRDMRRNGSVVNTLGKDPYSSFIEGNDDDDDDDEASISLHSSMPSLCSASLSSLATGILSAYPSGTNQIIVQEKPRDDKLHSFCNQLLLGAIQIADEPDPNAEAVCEQDHVEMVSYLHNLLAAAYTEGRKINPQSPPSASLDDSMPSLLDCISRTENSGFDLLGSTCSLQEEDVALGLATNVPRYHEEMNSSMPSLLTCRTGDLDLYAGCATKWASYGDLNHISEDEGSSTSSGSAEEASDALPPAALANPLPKTPMRRSNTSNHVPCPIPATAKPSIRRAKTESVIPESRQDSPTIDLTATPDTTFSDFISNTETFSSSNAKLGRVYQSNERRKPFLSLFPVRKGSKKTGPKAPVQTFRQRVSRLTFRNRERPSQKKPIKGRSEARFFPKEKRDEDGGHLLLP